MFYNEIFRKVVDKVLQNCINCRTSASPILFLKAFSGLMPKAPSCICDCDVADQHDYWAIVGAVVPVIENINLVGYDTSRIEMAKK